MALTNLCSRLMSLGNHDHSFGNEVHSLAFHDLEPRWYLPWLWYGREMIDGDTKVLFYAIDTDVG